MKYINFSTNVSFRTRTLRIIIGLGLLMGLIVVLPFLLPSRIIYLKFARYAITSFMGAFLVPLIFKLIKE